MTSRHPRILFAFVIGLQVWGGISLLLSRSHHSVVVPITVPLREPIVDLHVITPPTSQYDNQSAPSVRCDVINTTRDGIEINPEVNPFAIEVSRHFIYARHPVRPALLDHKDQISFDIAIRCSSSAGQVLTTSALVNVTSVNRWRHLRCHQLNDTQSADDTSACLCFAEGFSNFNIYENTIAILGRVGPLSYNELCPDYSDLQINYGISTADTRYADALKIKDGQLLVQRQLDREVITSIEATITCSIQFDQSTTVKASRDVDVTVVDVNDCGPVIYTSSGKVKVTQRTLAFDKTDKLTFQDGDADTGVNRYNIRVLGDPNHILEHTQPTLISQRFKLYGFDLRMTTIPERDLNASVVITDETLVSRDRNEARAIYHVYVKGRKPSVSSSLDGSHETAPQSDIGVSPLLSSTRQWNVVNNIGDDADNNNNNNKNNNTNKNNYSGINYSDEAVDQELGYTSEAYNELQQDGHVTTNNKPRQVVGHVTRTGVTLTREPTDHFRVNVSAAAAKYTRLFEVLLVKAAFSSFQIARSDADIPLDISPYSGILYTSGSLLPYSNKTLTVNIRGESIMTPFSRDLNIQIDVQVLPTSLPPTEHCENSCSSARSRSSCESMCGYGASSGRCVWRPAGGASHYSTCVPSLATCPDEECDEDLESVVHSLCPQDCAKTLSINGHVLEVKGISVTTRGLCYCDSHLHCTCLTDEKHNETSEYLPPSRCDTSCVVTITVTLAVTIVVAMLVLVFCRWRHQLRHGGMKHVSSLVSISAIPSDYVDDQDRPSTLVPSVDWTPKQVDPHFEPDPKWELPRSNLHLENIIGEGEFGRVVKAQAVNIQKQQGPITVAVKMLKECASTAEFRDLLSEYNLLKDVSHRNIIKLLGICSQKGPFLLVVEYCEHGSLRSYLRKSRNIGSYISRDVPDDVIVVDSAKKSETDELVITAKDCLSFAYQTANGMNYLCDMKLVHRDLATRNLLLATGKIIKISDFGLTRDIYEGDAYLKRSKGRIPVKWMAPESLYDQIYTNKSDVWSFGVVLWEIVTLGTTPYPGVPPERLCQLLKAGYRMEKPQGCSNELYDIMQQCWQADPAKRPTFKYIASLFEDMLKTNTMYLDLTYQHDILPSEDDITGGADHSSELKVSQSQNEAEYGSINILSTDNNSYVLTPSLQLNGEAMLLRQPQDDLYSNWSNDGKHSLDVSSEETHFLAKETTTKEDEDDFGKQSPETESLVNENRV